MYNKEKALLVTQSFGRESEYRRVILAILSAFVYIEKEKRNEIQIVLFTDNPSFFSEWFKGLNVHFVELTPDKIKVMRGNIDFLHRMKIALIEEAFEIFPNHNMFYVDSDTFFIGNPLNCLNKISENISSMHLTEYKFEYLKDLKLPAGESFQAFFKLITAQKFQVANGNMLEVLPDDTSWNAGVMCLHHSHANFLKDVYSLTDQFYLATKNHASEQYAFSIMLQKFATLIPCDDIVYHYWYRVKKVIIDEQLSKSRFLKLESQSFENKITSLKKYTQNLPNYIDAHFHILMDSSIQSFNENNFKNAYVWLIKAFFKSPLRTLNRAKDILYHSKRYLLRNK